MKKSVNKQVEAEIDRPEYWVRNALSGFGWEILKRNPSFTRVFHTSDKNQAKKALEDFKKSGETKLKPITNWEPQYLRLNEKHYAPVYLVRNEEQLYEIALDIVKTRNKEKWFHFDNDPYFKEITQEMIDSISHEKLKEEAIKMRERYLDEKKSIKENLDTKKYLDYALENNDGKAAWQFMRDRNGYQYENFELSAFSNTNL